MLRFWILTALLGGDALVVKAAKRQQWDATMATTPSMVTDRLVDLYHQRFSAITNEQSGCNRSNLQQCTCFEVLETDKSLHSKQDIQKGFRKASKEFHPDKGGKAEDFMFLKSCYLHLREPAMMRRYSRQIRQIGRQGSWRKSQFREQVKQLNDRWIVNAAAPRSLYDEGFRETTKKTARSKPNLLFCWPTLVRGVYTSFVRGKQCYVYCDSKVVQCVNE